MANKKRNPAPVNKVVGYIRVSTDEQASEGFSLDAQRARLQAYCTAQGLHLVDLIADPGVSAGRMLPSRPGGRRLLDLIASGAAGGVVAIKLDRLFRNAVDCLSHVERWDATGVSLHLLDLAGQTVNTRTAMGKMLITVAAGFAEMERNVTAERTTAALTHKRSKGERLGRVPYGYQVGPDGVHLEPSEPEQYVLARLQLLRSEGLTLQAITDRLNADGTAPPRAAKGGKQGSKWHLATVHRLLNRAPIQVAA